MCEVLTSLGVFAFHRVRYFTRKADDGDGTGPLTEFLTVLALCHTVIPERPNDSDEVGAKLTWTLLLLPLRLFVVVVDADFGRWLWL